MELRHLRYFVAVAEDLNYRRAAIRLNMSQPPLSKQIMDLEAELGTRLFNRQGRRISLTPSGTVFLKRAQAILDQVELSREEITRIELGNYGILNIGFVDDIQFGPLSSQIADFQQKYPEVLLYSTLELSPNLARMVLQGELDAAIVEPPLPLETRNLASFQLPSIRLLAVLPKNHPFASRDHLRLDELKEEKFVICTSKPATSFRTQIDRLFEEAGFKPRLSHISNATIMYTKIAAKAGHVSIASEHAIAVDSGEFTCVPIRSTSARIQLSLLWNVQNANNVAHNFIQFIRSQCIAGSVRS